MSAAFTRVRTWAPRALALLALALVAPSCKENMVAPGSCPALCPAGRMQIVDTTYTGVVVADSTFRGYVSASQAGFLVLSDLDSMQSVGLIRFQPRDTTWIPGVNDTLLRIGRVDSVRVSLNVSGRDTTMRNIRVLVYRLPVTFDTAMTWAGVQSYLVDSLLIDSIAVPDTLKSGLVTQRIRSGVLETLPPEDNQQVALALRVRANGKTSLSIGSAEDYAGATRLLWNVHAPAPRDTVSHQFAAGIQFDTFVYTPASTVPAAALAAGGIPAARAVLRFALDSLPGALDSLGLVRATLILTPIRKARGRPGEGFRLSARGLVRDYGAKSTIFSDTSAGGTALIYEGDSAEVRIEISRLLRVWGASAGDSLPRALMLLSDPEGAGMGEVVVAGHGAGAAAPRLRITYVRPYVFGVP